MLAIDSADVGVVKNNHPTCCIFSHWLRTPPQDGSESYGGELAFITSLPSHSLQVYWLPVVNVLSPAVGAVLMSISTIVVALYSMTLKLEIKQ
jgi:hypothetical protein